MLSRTAPRPGLFGAPASRLGPYHLIEVLDQSASGVTWLARAHQRPWGVKLSLRPDDEGSILREGENLNQINDVHVVRLAGQGRAADGRPYLVLEWLEGEPLDVHLRRMGQLSVARALHLTRQLLLGLRAVHAAQLVHRDLRLPGLFLAREGGREVLKLIDLGSALPWGTWAPRAPMPEPSACDPRDDLYAVGLVLYELVTGHPPFVEGRPGDGPLAWMHAHAQPLHPGIALPEGLWRLILTLLEKRREDRFRTVDQALEALERVTRHPSFQPFLERADPDLVVPATPRSTRNAPSTWRPRWWWPAVPLVLGVIAFAIR
jgi:serine/threonine protein kinase